MIKRFAIYARYSSDLQQEKSIDDQVHLCRAKITDQGGVAAGVYTDRAISGSSMVKRHGLCHLLKDAQAKRFTCVMAESLDRLSRSQKDTAFLYKLLKFHGIGLSTLDDGDINELHVGLKGTMNALFLSGLGDKVRRGQMGRVRQGRAGNGRVYGYRPVPKMTQDGKVEKGYREIIPEQAKIVQRIFEDYAAGRKTWRIARDLTDEGIPSPRGKAWQGTGICFGNRGMINNPIYIGQVTYNRQVKNHSGAATDYVCVNVPALRIISDELWHRAQHRQKNDATRSSIKSQSPRRSLLAGLVYCGVCNQPARKRARGFYRCSKQISCTNARGAREDRVFSEICRSARRYILDGDFWARAQARVHLMAARLATLETEESTLVEKIETGAADQSTYKQLIAIEQQCSDLDRCRRIIGQTSDQKLRSIQTFLLDELADMLQALQGDQTPGTGFPVLRKIVQRITFFPEQKRGHARLEVTPSFDGLFNLATGHEDHSFDFGDN